jgi:NADH-quinone oxidoreductase subunit A
MNDFLPIFVFMAVSIGLALLITGISVWFGPRRRAANESKLAPYESGMKAIGQGQRRLPVRFYLIAVLFILFDVEVIFMYPWAVAYRQLGLFGLVQMVLFLGILFAGYVWVWKKGALDWEKSDKSG